MLYQHLAQSGRFYSGSLLFPIGREQQTFFFAMVAFIRKTNFKNFIISRKFRDILTFLFCLQ